jgi:hypothetical protein
LREGEKERGAFVLWWGGRGRGRVPRGWVWKGRKGSSVQEKGGEEIESEERERERE